MPTFTEQEKKTFWRTARLLLYSLLVVLGLMAAFGMLPWIGILQGFGWLLIVAALMVIVYHVIEYVRRA